MPGEPLARQDCPPGQEQRSELCIAVIRGRAEGGGCGPRAQGHQIGHQQAEPDIKRRRCRRMAVSSPQISSDVDGAQLSGPALGADGEHGPGGVDGGDAGHGVLHGRAADLEAVGIVAAAAGGVLMTRSTEPEAIISRMLGWASDTRATQRAGMPASLRALQVPLVARISMPISSKPLAMPIISSLSSSLTVMMMRPPLGGLHTGALEGLEQRLGKDSARPRHSPVDFISGPGRCPRR